MDRRSGHSLKMLEGDLRLGRRPSKRVSSLQPVSTRCDNRQRLGIRHASLEDQSYGRGLRQWPIEKSIFVSSRLITQKHLLENCGTSSGGLLAASERQSGIQIFAFEHSATTAAGRQALFLMVDNAFHLFGSPSPGALVSRCRTILLIAATKYAKHNDIVEFGERDTANTDRVGASKPFNAVSQSQPAPQGEGFLRVPNSRF